MAACTSPQSCTVCGHDPWPALDLVHEGISAPGLRPAAGLGFSGTVEHGIRVDTGETNKKRAACSWIQAPVVASIIPGSSHQTAERNLDSSPSHFHKLPSSLLCSSVVRQLPHCWTV